MKSNKNKNKQINMSKCKASLGRLWLIGFGVLLFLLIAQHVLGKFDYKTRIMMDENKWEVKTESKAVEAWKWFITFTLPALSLIVGAWKIDILRKKPTKDRKMDRSIFRILYSFSLLYLVAIGLVFLLNPFSRFSQVELMRQSKAWALPFQGVVGTSLGAFFVLKKESLAKFFKFKKKGSKK